MDSSLSGSAVELGILNSCVAFLVQVASLSTMFQTIDVYDILIPQRGTLESYEKSLTPNSNSYEALHPEFFQPDRIIFLGGMLQSRRMGDAAYHEALVHPAMFAHPQPKRVSIIGGGEGATLREILKHNTLETVVMVEIDEGMVNASRQFIPEWNDCSNLRGRAENCFDDERTQLYCEDAFAWFKDRFLGPDSKKSHLREEPFDVIIMDAL